jgi:hypothetical protein
VNALHRCLSRCDSLPKLAPIFFRGVESRLVFTSLLLENRSLPAQLKGLSL